MNILVLNGSPRTNGNCADMIAGFKAGAEEAGHTVVVEQVGKMHINGCLACEYCHTKEDKVCVQKDDMQQLYPQMLSADMIVFASPIYYYTLSAQLDAVIQRTYSCGALKNVKKLAMILSSGSPNVYGAAVYLYEKCLVRYWDAENAGIFTAHGEENHSKEKWEELYQFGKSLQ